MAAFRDVAQLQRKYWPRNYGWWSKMQDRCEGRRDGKGRNPQPPLRGQNYAFGDSIIANQAAVFSQFHTEVIDYEGHLRERREKLRRHLEDYEKPGLDSLEERHNDALENLKRSIGPESQKYKDLQNEHKLADEEFNSCYSRLHRPLDIHFTGWYFWFMTVFAVSEVPINRLAFELFFMETPFISFIISLVVGILLVFLAHCTGLFARHATDDAPPADDTSPENVRRVRRRRLFGNLAGIIAILAFLVPFVYIMAKLRQLYVNFIEGEISGDLAQLIEQTRTTEILTQALGTELGDAGIFLLVLNATIFLAGTLLSFFRHDRNQAYQSAFEQRQDSARKLGQLNDKFGRRRERLKKHYEGEIERRQARIAEIKGEIAEIDERLKAIAQETKEVLNQVVQTVRARLSQYERANRASRPDKGDPECFGWTEEDIRNRITHGTTV